MTAQISDATAKFLGQVMPVIVGTRRRNGAVNLNPAWYELRDGYLRLNSRRGAHSLDHLERDRQATLFFIDPQGMFRGVHAVARAVETPPDAAGEHIDRLFRRYRGQPLPIPSSTGACRDPTPTTA